MNNSRYLGISLYFCIANTNEMNIDFDDKDLKELIETGYNRKYRKYAKNRKFMDALLVAYNYMVILPKAADLGDYPFLRYEKLKYNMSGKSSIRVLKNCVERIIFREYENGIRIEILDLDDTHYGNKK